MPDPEPLDDSPLRTLAWANYLGMSWTWCIGMFLPVLLVRDYGFWGWLVFAFPNVVGSALFGSAIGTAGRSRAIVAKHTPMMAVFSIVTVAFHVFFIGWLIPILIGLLPAAGTFLLVAVFYLIAAGTNRRVLALAAGVLAVSIAAMAIVLTQPLDDASLLTRADPSFGLIALSPVFLFGFFFCPYLDLTYHHARQSTAPQAGVRAFQIGFAGPFLLMIVFSLLYARWMSRADRNHLLAIVIGVHLCVQAAFTMSLHARTLIGSTKEIFRSARTLLVVACAIAIGLVVLVDRFRVFRDQSSGEVVYLSFLGFYGSLFPAYVWTCLFPGRGGSKRRRVAVVALVSAIAIACEWMGFVEGQVWWLLPGAAVLIAARWMLPLVPSAGTPGEG